MTPATVQFTNFELRPDRLASARRVDGPFPADWTRLVLFAETLNHRPIEDWVLANINGRFGLLAVYPEVAVFFEDVHDAILFRMKGGDTAWQEDHPEF